MTIGGRLGAEHADLGDRDLEVGQDFEQVRLELVVGTVDLVDQQHRWRTLDRFDRPQQRPLDQETLAVQLGLQFVRRAGVRLARGLGGAQVQQLAGVVPVVHGLRHVDALVALQADELTAGRGRQGLGQLGLADAGLALEEQRSVQGHRQEHRRRDALVGQVSMPRERTGDGVGSHRRDATGGSAMSPAWPNVTRCPASCGGGW